MIFTLQENNLYFMDGIAGLWSLPQHSVDLLLTVGGAMRTGRDSAAALGANAVHCRDKDEALARLTAYCRPGDAVLVKASHGMAFETILDGFYKAVPRD